MNFQLEQRIAVVTGGSSGIGFETLRLLLAEGTKVAFAAATRTNWREPKPACVMSFHRRRSWRCAATCLTRHR